MSKRNGKKSSFRSSFAIIHHFNSPNSAMTLDGKEVKREDKLWYCDFDDQQRPVWGTGRFISVATYDNHFIYIDPMWRRIKGRSHYMCTCGAMGVIVGYNAYRKDASPSDTGELFVCHVHATYGKHADGSS